MVTYRVSNPADKGCRTQWNGTNMKLLSMSILCSFSDKFIEGYWTQNIVHNMNNMTVTCFDILINDDGNIIDVIIVAVACAHLTFLNQINPQHCRRWTFGHRIFTVYHFKFGPTDKILVPDRTDRNMKQYNVGNYIILE